MTDTDFDWPSFLARWSGEWADAQDPDASPSEDEARALRERRLGFAPASPERIAEAERRLGRRLPPSYRAFLEVTDGWRHAGGFVSLLAGTQGARWFEDEVGFAELYEDALDEDSTPEEVRRAGMWGRALQLDVESDITYVLMDPGDVDEDGEWAVSHYKGWSGDLPERHGSFREFMEAMYAEFHQLSVHRGERSGRRFVNATTEALDADIEAARRDALAGRYARAEAVLARAEEFGRPRAKPLLDQIRWLLGRRYLADFAGLALHPVYGAELLPLLAMEHVRSSHDEASWGFRMRGATDEARRMGDALVERTRDGAFQYTAAGVFGRAVDEAREHARWGRTDTAWRVLARALPQWEPLGPDHLAPVGLLADPVLAPVITEARGRLILSTPRAGEPGEAPAPEAETEPDGLAWLAAQPEYERGYRFVLVEGVAPAELPARLGDAEGGGLQEPVMVQSSAMWPRRSGSSHEDKALVAVGSAGDGWSFAFDAQPGGFADQRFVSPVAAASGTGRALVVWSAPGTRFDGTPDVFHLSMAEGGEERYAFTVRRTEVSSSGYVPEAFEPGRLFTPEDFHPEGELRALRAVAEQFGVSLPRFALTRGRLHTFRTRSWTRPPAPGETYLAVSVTAHRSGE
ncbi:SMI1/KNR4 family protein [Streptomyces sp. NPDC008238]